MMHYAQVILEAKSLGCDDAHAKDFARKVISVAAMLALMPEDVLKAWNDKKRRENPEDTVVKSLSLLGAVVPEEVA